MRIRTPFLALGLSLMIAGSAAATGQHPYAYPQPEDTSEGFLTVIEIPAGSITKYEIDADHGYVLVDRYMSMPVAYPANYGSIPSSLGGDGDPLDGLILTREPVVPGAVIRVRAIGVLNMIDRGEEDSKIVAVPVSDVDPTYDEIKSIEDLPKLERDRIEAFFRVYKDLPGGVEVELNGYDDAATAAAMVEKAITDYRAKQ